MNGNQFTGLADVYAKYRPSYPDALFNYLYGELGFDKAGVIADIACGTGIFSKPLLERGSYVICIDSNEEMLARAKVSLSGFENCKLIRAYGENTTLPDAGVDFVTIAQAFNWLDTLQFKTECQRILKRSGKVVVVYNQRSTSDVFAAATDRAYKKYCPEFNGYSGGARGIENGAYRLFFSGRGYETKTFENNLTFTEESFVGRSLSASYSPRPGSPNYDAFIDELKEVFESHSCDGVVRMANSAICYVGGV